jgi:mannose-6-phosphate isomerase-like protein (cupin superfamily)
MKPKKVPFRKGFSVVAQNKRSQAASMVIAPGEKQGGPDNNHRGADQWLFVLSGKGSVTIAGRKFKLETSSLVLIERGQSHEIENLGTTDLVTLNFYLPPAYTKSGDELPPAKPK